MRLGIFVPFKWLGSSGFSSAELGLTLTFFAAISRMASSAIKAAGTVAVGAAMVAVGAAKAMKTLAGNDLFTDFPAFFISANALALLAPGCAV